MEEAVTLNSIAGGVLPELFDREMKKVVENVLDLNSAATAVRTINIKIKIKPDEKRNFGHVSIVVISGIASQNPYGSTMYFGRKGGEAQAIEPPHQKELFPVEKPRQVVNFTIPQTNTSAESTEGVLNGSTV